MANSVSNIEVIETVYKSLCELQKKPSHWSDDKSIIELYDILYNCLHNEIHGRLMSFQSKENETQIRNLIRRYVIGCKEKGRVFLGALPCIENKIAVLSARKNKDHDSIKQYLDLYDDFMALASFRSYKHFCIYIEKIFNIKLFERLGADGRALSGYLFYANQMVLDGKVKFLEKQLPTSYGKSLSDCFMIAWIFGQNIDDDVLKVFGNNGNIDRAFDTIVQIMLSSKYAKVFPYFQRFEGKQDNMFSIFKAKDGKFKINGSKKPVNLEIISKDMKRSGIRAKWLFLDDVTQAEDKMIKRNHEQDIAKYNDVWFKRRYSSDNFYIVAGGTTYSIYDILSHLKEKFGWKNAIRSNVNKYTYVGVSNQLVLNGVSVFVCVPKLDYDTDESTYPEEYPTLQARAEREEDYETFMAMEQQTPCQPKENPFYMTRLQTYTIDTLPAIGQHGRTESCWAYLDGKRKGSDFCAMPILTPIGEAHYLIDAIYDNRPMKECYASIVAKISQHHITRLVIENNVNEGLKTLLQNLLDDSGIYYCYIDEVFNTTAKDIRISNAEAEIKSSIVFPSFGTYARSSQMGQALDELYTYTFDRKNDHDDFTDALSGYVESFVSKNKRKTASISIFMR